MLVQATSNNGKLFALARTRNPYRDAPLGVIEVGAWADLLLYDGRLQEHARFDNEGRRSLQK
jgi:imidazolonepropionase-like amidohydrolase